MTFALSALRNTHLLADLASKIRRHSVLISDNPDLRYGGTGTLVIYKNFCGILTATHVIAENINISNIYAPVLKTADPTYFLNTQIPIERILFTETPEGLYALKNLKNWPEQTLDICLLQIRRDIFDRILHISGKEPIDLLSHKTLYSENFDKYCNSEDPSHWSWAIEGYPREEGAKHDNNNILETKFGGLYLCGGSKEKSTFSTQPLTLVTSPFDRDADLLTHDICTSDELPSRFGGISGAGVWQVSFQGTNGCPELINEMLFTGVCVAGEPGRCLSSRGPTSLFDIFTGYLDVLQSSATFNLASDL